MSSTHLRLVILACLWSCSSPPPPAPPAPAATKPQQAERSTTARVDLESLPDTGLLGQLKAELAARNAASERAVMVHVRPDTVRLHVGERLHFTSLEIVALDSSGAAIVPFGPAFHMADSPVAVFKEGALIGLSPGTTALTIGAPSRDPSTGKRGMRALTQVVVIVLDPLVPS